MTELSREEVHERFSAIADGPWARGVEEARRRLAPVGRLDSIARGPEPIDLDRIPLSTPDLEKNDRLMRVLRSHLGDEIGITDRAEIETREALDQALTLPQLYELAVETGYLPSERVKNPARELLTDLLWSAAARGFVATYDYLGVSMLATRVGVSGLAAVQPPQPNEDASLRFAGFLAHLRAFYEDDLIQTWTHFMDDYIFERDEQNKVWLYLQDRDTKAPTPKRITELLSGCQLFVTSLAGAFHVLDNDELGHFGLVHAYWLQKFLGYKLENGIYVKNTRLWGEQDSWANTVTNSPHLVGPDTDQELAAMYRQQFRDQVQLIEHTFDAVRKLVASARATTGMQGYT